jgi:CubicO group peptidase (beta-lactamase class C family)
MISKFALAACFGALQGCTDNAAVSQCPPVSAAPPVTSAAISSTLDSIKEKYKLNAIIFGAEQDGKPLVRTALGVSTTGVPATTDMHFRIGGVGWQVLSTVLLRMIEQDPVRIALTDRVSKWYPDYPNADRATVRMLAASSAGFGDYIATDAFIAEVTANPLRVWTADDLIARSVLPYQKPQFDDPGHNWKYSHTDFVVLGAVLEKASGKKYAALLQELILDPLALRDTRFQLDAAPQLPVLHTLQEGDFRDSTYWNPSFVSWSAVTSNICDLGKWNRSFGTGSLLSPAESRVLGNVHDDGLRSDDGNVAGGNCLVERRLATGGAAERRDHHGGLEAADA